MTDSTLVNVFDSRNQFKVELAGLFLSKPGVSHDIIKEFSTVCILHDHIELLLSLNNLIQLNYIWMSDLLQYLYLSCDSLYIFLIVDLVFLKDLNSHFLSCKCMLAQLDLPKGTFAKMFA